MGSRSARPGAVRVTLLSWIHSRSPSKAGELVPAEKVAASAAQEIWKRAEKLDTQMDELSWDRLK